jgi:tripartite-type tricarboxylate transporter receptor subunit TctC
MKFCRRQFLNLAAGAGGGAAVAALSRIARAQTYPSRPVRILVGFGGGSAADILARLIGHWLSDRLGQQFITENRSGAGANIATEAVVRAPADGYTLLWVTSANANNAALYEHLNFNFIRDIAPVASITRVPHLVAVNFSFPAKTIPDLIADAKANPGRINIATGANGGTSHLASELFMMMAGIKMVRVPYSGDAPALTGLLGRQVDVLFVPLQASIEFIRTGKLRALAVTSAQRLEVLPDIPTVAEYLPGYEASGWTGIGVPRNTPAEIVDELNKAINAGLVDPALRARLAELGGTVLGGSPAAFGELIAEETEKWGKVIRAAGITAE